MPDNHTEDGLPDILLDILRCPADKAKLEYHEEDDTLVCTECGTAYPVEGNIPVMLNPKHGNEEE
ncbi:Trm112 family protein [Salininema proteolyticum]|uniref:Trm112 family protein n=1 Tax=Salininema proteolyticum TaxID=1607685 RepID=A0ABV8TT80_9ACTN